MAQEKEYFAFISYQRKDEEWADRLRSRLEHYRLSSSVRKQDASLPKEIRPIFRDALELAGGVLAKEIESALQQSKYLIVICSPNSAKSPWLNKEIKTFIDLLFSARFCLKKVICLKMKYIQFPQRAFWDTPFRCEG